MAVAGFAENELSVESKEGVLTIRGAKDTAPRPDAEKREMLYQGIAARAFERRFHLADHVSAVKAAVENGLLHVDLVREVPEAQKPRSIPIQTASAKTIEVSAPSRLRNCVPKHGPEGAPQGRLFRCAAARSPDVNQLSNHRKK